MDNNYLNEEEAHFYSVIESFEDLFEYYDAEQIIESLQDKTYIALFDFFMPPEVDDGNDD